MGGTIDGIGIRGTILEDANGWCFSLGPAWLRDCTVRPGVEVEVMILPEGSQRSDLAPDIVVRSRRTDSRGVLRHARPILSQRLPAVDRRHETPARRHRLAPRSEPAPIDTRLGTPTRTRRHHSRRLGKSCCDHHYRGHGPAPHQSRTRGSSRHGGPQHHRARPHARDRVRRTAWADLQRCLSR